MLRSPVDDIIRVYLCVFRVVVSAALVHLCVVFSVLHVRVYVWCVLVLLL